MSKSTDLTHDEGFKQGHADGYAGLPPRALPVSTMPAAEIAYCRGHAQRHGGETAQPRPRHRRLSHQAYQRVLRRLRRRRTRS